jgi:hypothetical protein
MKQGKTISELATQLDHIRNNKLDLIGSTSNTTAIGNGDLRLDLGVDGREPFGLNNVAHSQVAAALKIPKPYYDRMRTEQPELLAHNVNVWMHKEPKNKMFRTLDGNLRAFVSDRFRPLDNSDLAEAVLPTLADLDLTVESCELTEQRMYIKAIHPTLTSEVKVGTIMAAGVVIKGSDVGMGSTEILRFVKELRCTNGWIVEKTVSQRHIGRSTSVGDIDNAREFFTDHTRRQEDKAFFLKMRDTVAALFNKDEFEKSLTKFREAGEQEITADPMKVVEFVADKYRFTEDEKGSCLSHLIRGGDLSKLGLGAAITRTAQDLEDYDRATEFEATGTKLVELPRTEWEKVAIAA